MSIMAPASNYTTGRPRSFLKMLIYKTLMKNIYMMLLLLFSSTALFPMDLPKKRPRADQAEQKRPKKRQKTGNKWQKNERPNKSKKNQQPNQPGQNESIKLNKTYDKRGLKARVKRGHTYYRTKKYKEAGREFSEALGREGGDCGLKTEAKFMLYRLKFEGHLEIEGEHITPEKCIKDLTDILNLKGMERNDPIRPPYKTEMEKYIKSLEVSSNLDDSQMDVKTAPKSVEPEIAEEMAIEVMPEQETSEPRWGYETIILPILQFFQKVKAEAEYYFL